MTVDESVFSPEHGNPLDGGQPVGLSPHQRKLPKLDLRLFSGVVVVFLLVAGVGSATILTQYQQDIRQQAYNPTALLSAVTPKPEPVVAQETDGISLPTGPEKQVTRGENIFGYELPAGLTPEVLMIVLIAAGAIAIVLAILLWVAAV